MYVYKGITPQLNFDCGVHNQSRNKTIELDVPRWHARRLTIMGWGPGLGIKLE